MASLVLTLNGGSSSVKFSLFDFSLSSPCIIRGEIEHIGLSKALLTYRSEDKTVTRKLSAEREEALETLFSLIKEKTVGHTLSHVGHRVVHGMGKEHHEKITEDLLLWLKGISPIDPEHLPREIELIEKAMETFPGAFHVACFDTVFHRHMPRVATLLPFSKEAETFGVRRYGFHGLSLASVLRTLSQKNPGEEKGRIIALHLGSGVSVTAIRDAKSIDTSMAFSPAGGVPMSSRTGDVDPGALLFLMKRKGISTDDAISMVNHSSGLAGLSGTSDMETLLSQEQKDGDARDAVALFCYEIKKRIGAYIAIQNGVDTIICSGGIGERSPLIRERILSDLTSLGILLDKQANQEGKEIISPPGSQVTIRVLPANEELEIASIAYQFPIAP